MNKSFLSKIFIIFLVLIAAELVALLNRMADNFKNQDIKLPYSEPVKTFEELYYKDIPYYSLYPFGKVYGKKYTNVRPIIIFGDSAAYGEGLEEADRFSVILSESIKHTVYNKSFGGWSVQNIYWILSNPDIYKEIKNPEAVIIVYTPFMFESMYNPDFSNGLKYTIKNGKIIRDSLLFLYLKKSYLFSKITALYAYYKASKFDDSFDDFSLYLLEGRKYTEKHWKNTKFYIIKMTDSNSSDNPAKWEKLKNEGFIIISVQDMLGDNFCRDLVYVKSIDDLHPTRKLWEKIIMYICKNGELIENTNEKK